jgi:hypothetical protein
LLRARHLGSVDRRFEGSGIEADDALEISEQTEV